MAMQDTHRIFARAERAADAGDWAAASAGYLQTLALDPAHVEAMLQLSYAGSVAGHYRAAREWALRAAAGAPPRRPEALLELLRRLRTFNEAQALRDLGERLRRLPGIPPAILVELARQLSNLNVFASALDCAETALRAAPESPAARLVRGQLLAHHGRIDEAEADFLRVLQRNPRIAIGWWMLSRLRMQTSHSNHVPQLQALLRTPGLPSGDVAAAARALHKELDDLGNHDGAWEALQVMCRARRATVQYEPSQTRALVDDLIACRVSGPQQDTYAAPGVTPVFIVGMHRSGTTLLEQLLDGSPQVHAAGELNDFTAALRHATDRAGKGVIDRDIVAHAAGKDLAEVGRRYMDGLAWRLGGERFITDKQPSNFLGIGFICAALPQAKILHLQRDPMETCFSNLRELFSDINPHSWDQVELADYFLQYRRLMAHWRRTFPGRILDVPYAALTQDTEATMRAVARHCGIDYVPEMTNPGSSTRAVATASGVQVRDRVIHRKVPKWAAYAGHLEPLRRALREGGIEVADVPA